MNNTDYRIMRHKNGMAPICGFIICAISICLSYPQWCFAKTLRYTLSSAIERALKANPTLEEKIEALESAKMSVGVAQSYFWPRLSLFANKNTLKNSGGYGSVDEISNTSTSSGFRGSLSIFAGFTHLTNLQRFMIEKEIVAEELRQAELELVANAKFNSLRFYRQDGICGM